MKFCLKAWRLARQVKDRSSVVREKAVRALGETPHPRAVKALIEALGDTNRDVQIAAAEALAKQNDPTAAPALLALAEKEGVDAQAQQAALRTLERMTAVAFPALQARFTAIDCRLRPEIAEVFGKAQERRATPLLVATLNDPDVRVRKEAVHALGLIGDLQAVEPLMQELDDERWLLRAEMAEALGRLGDKRAVERLIALLRDSKWIVQMSAAKALARLGDRSATEPLIALLQSDNEDVKGTVAEMLGKLGDPRAVAPLVKLLRDPNVAHNGLCALRQLLKQSAAALAPAELEGLKKMEDPFQQLWETTDETTALRGSDPVRQRGMRKLDASEIRRLASEALATR